MKQEIKDYASRILSEMEKLVPGIESEEFEKQPVNGGPEPVMAVRRAGNAIGIGVPVGRLYGLDMSPEDAAAMYADYLLKPAPFSACDVMALDRSKVYPHLVNRAQNAAIEADSPTRTVMGDLLMYYACELAPGRSYRITHGLARYYSATEKELYACAMENLRGRAVVRSVYEILRKQAAAFDVPECLLPPDTGAYAVTRDDFMEGAAALLLPEIQEKLSGIFGGDIMAIPSSRHEFIVRGADMGPEETGCMIRDVNAEELPPEDVLSDHAYVKRWNSSEFEPYVA